jgi:PHD/YefM family antitoxin component YafN of YafNO toxin-antitoxin module
MSMEKIMKILIETLVSNSEMIKNYKDCRAKAEHYGKVFILKNNKPDAVLFSISEYEKLSQIVEYVEGFGEVKIAELLEMLSKDDNKTVR